MSRSEEVELKPCPFCGGEAEMDTHQGYNNYSTGARETGIAIYCRDCGVQNMICRGDVPDVEPEHVIEFWNTRAPSALPVGRNDLARDIGGVANLLEHRMTTEGNMERENTRLAVETLRRAQAMLSASPPPDHVPDVGNMISPPEPVSGWRDIATAPRDGTDILVYFSGRLRGVWKVSWENIHGDRTPTDGIWCVDDNKHGQYALRGYSRGDDTHWKPLPEPPR